VNALARLEALGYSFSVEGENIRFRYEGKRVPDPEQVTPLLEVLRQQKSEALRFLREQEAERNFQEAWDEIRNELPHGMVEHIRRRHPEHQERIDQAEEAVETAWASTGLGLGSTVGLRKALEAWKDRYRAVIYEHKPMSIEICRAEKGNSCRKDCYAGITRRPTHEN
jgi:hypothetical protein